MTDLSNYAENALLDHALGTSAWTMPTNTYMKLHLGDPGEDCTLNPAAETDRTVMSWAVAASGAISSNADTTWASVSAAETFTHFSIWDAATAGNPLAYGALSASQGVGIGDEFRVDSGDCTLSFAQTLFTLAAANLALDHLTGRSAWTMPAGAFVKLHLGAPGNAATANPAAETTRESGTFAAASAGATDNTNVITYSAVAASETVSHYSVWTAATGGAATLQGALTTSKALTAGQDARWSANALAVALT